MPVTIFVIVILFTGNCVQCSSVHVCNDVRLPVLLNNSSGTSVPIAVDCSAQCEELAINITFYNNLTCSWNVNGKSRSPLLIPYSKTGDSVRVNLTAMCLEEQTPAILQCNNVNIYTPIYSLRIPIYNCMYLHLLCPLYTVEGYCMM